MPSARDLLQQADALMRSNRNVGKAEGDENIPVLTDVAVQPRNPESDSVMRSRDERIPVLTNIVPEFDLTVPKDSSRARFPGSRMESSLLPLSEMPPIPPLPDYLPLPPIPSSPSIPSSAPTDEAGPVEGMRRYESRIDTGSGSTLQPPITEMPKWLAPDLLSPSPADVSFPSSVPTWEREEDAAPPPPMLPKYGEEPRPGDSSALVAAEPPPDDSPALVAAEPLPDESPALVTAEPLPDESPALVTAEPLPDESSAHADAGPEASAAATDLAETIYYQVLQNLDLYTEGKLQEHLTRHLTPIMEQASRELLATLNANLGAVIRQYVAEAIEKQLGVRPTGDPRA